MSLPAKHVFVCSQTRPPHHPRGSCSAKGCNEVLQTFWKEFQRRGMPDGIAITYSGCLGPCDQGPNVVVYPEAVLYSGVTVADVPVIFEEHLLGGTPVERLAVNRPPA